MVNQFVVSHRKYLPKMSYTLGSPKERTEQSRFETEEGHHEDRADPGDPKHRWAQVGGQTLVGKTDGCCLQRLRLGARDGG